MSQDLKNTDLQKIHLGLRLLGTAFLLWETSTSKAHLLSQPLPFSIGLELGVFYLLVCSGLIYSRQIPLRVPILIGYDLLIGTVLLILYGGEWAFALPFFFATYVAAMFSWNLSVAVSVVGAALFLAAKLYSQGAREEILMHPEWLLFLVLSLALSTLGLFRFESIREKEKAESLIYFIEAGQFGAALSHEDLFKLTLEIVKGIFSATTFAVYLKDEAGVLKLQAAHGPDSTLLRDFDPREAKTVLADVATRRASLVLEDLHSLPEGQEKIIPRTPHIRAAMAVPLVFANESIGLFFAATSEPKAYNKDSKRLFVILANQAAVSFGNVKLHEKAALLAATDSVSGLYTYGYMQEFLEREFRRCKYANLPLSAILLDVDELKKVNEMYGHSTGDSILRQFGVVVKGVTRATDVVCRYAGDEFMIALPETNRIGAMLVAERVRIIVKDYEFVAGSNIIRLTVSGGVASYPEDVETRKELTEKAEQTLAEAKKQGHGKVLC